ncbi:unnamed protein product [Menidia menidia]|uniref:(Atlantic silverside) hypothetical protein n=1 Tax=Menidia menidia TaxID=238744 RepID=A0A8S4AML1_9TELE|nr:unnamed protein product [Menidia menidia]
MFRETFRPHPQRTTWDMPTRNAHSTSRMRSGTARTRWDSRNLETMAPRLAWAAGKEYTSMAMQSRKPGVISQGPLRLTTKVLLRVRHTIVPMIHVMPCPVSATREAMERQPPQEDQG